MTPWQKHLRLALGAFVIVFAAVVYLAMRNQPPPAPPKPALPRLDPRAKSEVTRGTYTQYKLDKEEFTLEYDRVLEYAEGTQKVQGVRARLKTKDGDVLIAGDEGIVGQSRANFVVTGNTQLRTPDGLEFRTHEASYAQGEGIVRAPGPTEFWRGRTRGSAVGLTYDQQRQVMTLLDRARLTTEDADSGARSDAQSRTAVWSRPDRTVRLEGDARIVRVGQTLEADNAALYLSADEQRVQRLELRGNSRITPSPPDPKASPGARAGSSELRAMRAHDINLTYAEGGQTLQQALLTGEGSVEVQSAGASGATRIAGEIVDLGFDEEGLALRTLAARGANAGDRAELHLPAQADSPARVVRSAVIQGPSPGAPRQAGATGLTSLRFTDDVEYRELQAPGRQASKPGVKTGTPAPRVAYAQVLDLALQPGLGSVDEARFSGNVRFTEGDALQASAGDARYVMNTGQLDLSGSNADGQLPKVVDEQTTIQAQSIQLTPEGRKVVAQQSVQAEFRRSDRRSDGSAVRTPAILSGDQPVLATSDRLDYDGAASRAVFASKGKSRLWQPRGGTTIHATEIILDDATGNLWANGAVVTTMQLEQVDQKTKQRQKVNSEGWADRMFYEDAARRATYTSNARLRGAEGDLRSDKTVLYLTQDGGALDHLEATGRVDLQTPSPDGGGMRTVTGDRLVYTASSEQYVMTGKTVKFRDECSETQSKSLTFFRSVGTIVVDGNQQRRSEMRSAQGCKKEPLPH